MQPEIQASIIKFPHKCGTAGTKSNKAKMHQKLGGI